MQPVVALTPYSVTVTLITLIIGVLTTAINTGKVLGKFQVPASWMVWLMIVAPFLGGVGTTLTQAGGLTSVSVFNAIVAGIIAVTAGAAPGVAVHLALHAHVNVPKLAAAMRAKPGNDNVAAAAVAASATKVAVILLVVGMLGGLVTTQSACGQPVFPTLTKIEQTIVDDLTAGKTDAQIASDVCADLGGSAGTDAACAQAEEIVQSTITILIDTGVLKGLALERGKAYQLRYSAAHPSAGK